MMKLYAYNFYSFYLSSIVYPLHISSPFITVATPPLLATCYTFPATKEKSDSNPQTHNHHFYHHIHSLLHTISLSAYHATCKTNLTVLQPVKDSSMSLHQFFKATLCFPPNCIMIFALL